MARSRDFRTIDDQGNLEILSDIAIDGILAPDHEILHLRSNIEKTRVGSLVGHNAAAKFRTSIKALFPDLAERETGAYLLLDDLPGAIFVSNWAWRCWPTRGPQAVNQKENEAGPKASMENVCIGLAAGSYALDAEGFPDAERQSSAIVCDVAHSGDPDGWHALPAAQHFASSRRHRWIDLAHKGGDLVVAAGFRTAPRSRTGVAGRCTNIEPKR